MKLAPNKNNESLNLKPVANIKAPLASAIEKRLSGLKIQPDKSGLQDFQTQSMGKK